MNKIMSFAAVAAMFFLSGCYVVPNSGDELENGDTIYDHYVVTDNKVNDETVTDNADFDEMTDETDGKDNIVDTTTMTDKDTTSEADMVTDNTVGTDTAEADEVPDVDNVSNIYPTASLSGPIGIDEGTKGTVKVSIDRPSENWLEFYIVFNPKGQDTAVYGTDYTVIMTDNRVVIPPGSNEASVIIYNRENERVDGNRTVTVHLYLGSNGVNLGNPHQIVIFLYDNDGVGTGTFAFDSTSAEVIEGNKICTNITRTGGTNTLPASVVVRKTSGDLNDVIVDPTGDYANGMTLNFATGESVKQVCVTAIADGIAEVDEKIQFNLETPSAQSKINPERNSYQLTVKDTAATEVVIDARNPSCNEFVMATSKANMKCYAYGARMEIFNTDTTKKYRLKGTCALDCPDLGTSDTFTCNGVGVSQNGFCELPLGGKGCAHNGDCR